MPSDPEKPFNGQTIFLFNLLLLTLISLCMIPRSAADKLITNYASKNTERITEAVKFVFGATYDRSEHDFLASEVSEEAMGNQIASFGSSVYVTYKQAPH